jgi:large subunit ribosomal protein L4
MAEIEVKNLTNEVVGKLELSDDVFQAPLNKTLIWEAVKHYEASLRSGTAATKTRGMVRGSGKKLWRQKGTGRARIGSVRSPLWRHGGTVHGPQPRSYVYSFPRKKIRGALRSALSARFDEKNLAVVDGFQLEGVKTKDLNKVLQGFGAGRKILLIDSGANRNLELSARNLPRVKLVPGQGVNIRDVVNHELLIFTKEAILQVQEVLSR